MWKLSVSYLWLLVNARRIMGINVCYADNKGTLAGTKGSRRDDLE